MILFSFISFYSVNSLKNEVIDCSNKIYEDEFINNANNLMKGKEKVAYLTFDDGPNVSVTPKS